MYVEYRKMVQIDVNRSARQERDADIGDGCVDTEGGVG